MTTTSLDYGSERLSALTDGVFAVALTLLVLDLKVPEVPAGAVQILREDLRAQIPNALAWVVSFVLLARFWMVHHDVLSRLSRIRVSTIVLNFLMLVLISIVPFSTALIGTYEFEAGPVAIFSTVMGLSGIATGLLARHVAHHPGLREDAARPRLHSHWRYHAFFIPAVAVTSMILSVTTHPAAALGVWLGEPLVAFAWAWRGR